MKKINIVASLAVAFFCSSAVWATTLSGIKYHSSVITLPEDTATVGISITTEVVTEGVKAVSDSLNAAMQPEKRLFTEGNDTVSTTAKKNGTVTGFVCDSKEGVAVNASVQLYSLPDSLLKGGKSVDENGKYTFNVPAGEYYLLVSFQGEKKTTKKFTVKEGKTEKIKDIEFASKELQETLIPSSRTYPVNLSLTVCDLAKLPLTNAMLKIYMLPEGFNSTAEFNTDALTLDTVLYSNLDGKFIVNGLPGENYLLRPYYLDEQLDDIIIRPIKEEAHEDTIIFNTVKHLKQTENLSVKTRDAFISLYKKHVGHSRNAKVYSEVYDYWKRAFCGNSDRYLMLYLDGISIINATISYDMEQKCYDRIDQLGEELMEVFELAIINIDSLNNQLKEGSDTLSVARLRAQQLEYYIQNWTNKKLIESPNSEPNLNEFFSDSLINIEIYNMSSAILASDNLDAEMKDLYNAALILRYKTQDEINRYNGDRRTAREFIHSDLEALDKKAQETFASIDPSLLVDNDKAYNNEISSSILDIRKWLIADIREYVEIYREKMSLALQQTGRQKESYEKVINEILQDDMILKSKDLEAQLLHLEAANYAYTNFAKTRDIYIKIADLELQLSENTDPGLSDEKRVTYLKNSDRRRRQILENYGKELSNIEKALIYLQRSEYFEKMAVIEPERAESYHLKLSKQNISKAEALGYPIELIPRVLGLFNSIKPELNSGKNESYLLASYVYQELSSTLDKANNWNKNTEIDNKYKYRDKEKLEEIAKSLKYLTDSHKILSYDEMFNRFGSQTGSAYKNLKITDKKFDVTLPDGRSIKTSILYY